MKLLYLHQVPLSSQKANILQVFAMCQAFVKTGTSVTLGLPDDNGTFKNSADIARAIEEKIGFAPHFNIKVFPSWRIGDRFKGPGALTGARRLIKKNPQIDYCFVRSIFLAKLAIRLGIKTIYESHTSELNVRSTIINRLYKSILLKTTRQEKLQLFVVISQALGKLWIQRGIPESKVMVLHDGVSIDEFRQPMNREEARKNLAINTNRKIVVYTGSLYRDRGIENILKLAKAFPEAFYYVVGGSGEEKRHWMKQVCRKDLNNIQFIGSVPHTHVKEYLFAADVLLMLWSWSVPTIHICSPLKVFEYMAAGRIIVGPGFPTICEVLEDNETALLSDPDSYADLENKMQTALSLEYPNDMAEKARRHALNYYTWENRAEIIINRLKENDTSI